MNPRLRRLLRDHDGVLTRADALAEVSRHVLDHAASAGHLCRLFPRVYVDANRAGDPSVRQRAALAWAGPPAALSHLTALTIWGLRSMSRDEVDEVHVLVPWSMRRRAPAGIVVRRRVDFEVERDTVVRGGLPVTRLEDSVVDSWPLLAPELRPEPAIRAVNERLTTAPRLHAAAVAAGRLPGVAELFRLINRLAIGCRSPLEIYGHDEILRGPGMPVFVWQKPVQLGDRWVYLDAYCEEARLNVELDGAGSHSSVRDRERDITRDAALAVRGIHVIRYARRRLLTEPDVVRREIIEIVRQRTEALRPQRVS